MSAARRIPRVERAFNAAVTLPGSKSIALRQLVMAALADAPTQLAGVPRCDDVDAMTGALRQLGVGIEETGPSRMAVTPPRRLAEGDATLHLRLSGVSLRLLLAVAALRRSTTRFDGDAPLRARPNSDLLEALRELGCEATAAPGGRLPIAVTGPQRFAPAVAVGTGVSSQYLSALLLVGPKLPRGLTLHLRDALVSAPYVRITRTEMARRGVTVEAEGERTLRVAAQGYAGGDIAIEGDASAATYHAALATLHASAVRLDNLGATTQQGDFAFLALCERLGANVTVTDASATIVGPAVLRPIERFDMKAMPDAAPTLMAMAPFLPKPIRIDGLATLPHKECDRIACPARELAKAGVRVETAPDAMTIGPTAPSALRPASFDTYDDHRMAMSLAVFASKAGGCEVRDPGCVAKTYADFWEDFERIYA